MQVDELICWYAKCKENFIESLSGMSENTLPYAANEFEVFFCDRSEDTECMSLSRVQDRSSR